MKPVFKCFACETGEHIVETANGWYLCKQCDIEYSPYVIDEEDVHEDSKSEIEPLVGFMKISKYNC